MAHLWTHIMEYKDISCTSGQSLVGAAAERELWLLCHPYPSIILYDSWILYNASQTLLNLSYSSPHSREYLIQVLSFWETSIQWHQPMKNIYIFVYHRDHDRNRCYMTMFYTFKVHYIIYATPVSRCRFVSSDFI